MKDIDLLNLILFASFLPFLISLIWIFSYVEVTLPLAHMFLLLSTILFMAGVYGFHPRVKHWRKAWEAWEKEYCYEEAET